MILNNLRRRFLTTIENAHICFDLDRGQTDLVTHVSTHICAYHLEKLYYIIEIIDVFLRDPNTVNVFVFLFKCLDKKYHQILTRWKLADIILNILKGIPPSFINICWYLGWVSEHWGSIVSLAVCNSKLTAVYSNYLEPLAWLLGFASGLMTSHFVAPYAEEFSDAPPNLPVTQLSLTSFHYEYNKNSQGHKSFCNVGGSV